MTANFPTPHDHSAAGNGILDDAIPLQNAIDAVANAGGGHLFGEPGSVYRVTKAPIVRDGVKFDLCGATIRQELSALTGEDAHGARVMNYASLGNGAVETISCNDPGVGLNAAYHAGVSIGPAYGCGGTVASPNPHEGVRGWRIHDLTVSTDKNITVDGATYGGVGVQVIGGAHNGIIERVTIPDSAVMAGGLHMDWGFLGPLIRDTDNPSQMQTNKAAYFNGTVRTTHPHHIVIRDNHIGKLTKPQVADRGSHGIRLSGCYAVPVTNNLIEQATYIGIFHHGGDYGFEFSDAVHRRQGLLNNRITGNTVLLAGLYGILADSYGDNLYRAVANGYDKIVLPIHEANLLIDGNSVSGNGSSTVGLLAHYINGVTIERNCFSYSASGVVAGSLSTNLVQRDNRIMTVI